MNIIVPLAGPDFNSNAGLKSLLKYNNSFLTKYMLDTRPWAKLLSPTDYIFVLHDDLFSRRFAKEHLDIWYEGCKSVFI